MRKSVYLLLFILTSFISSCTADDELDTSQSFTPVNNQTIEEKGEYHVLVIGNSLSRDAFCYVPPIIIDLCPNISIDFNIYYKGNVGLSTHWNSINNDIKDHTLDTYLMSSLSWHSTGSVEGKDIIENKQWNLIILQEGNVKSRYYENTQPNIKSFTDYIHSIHPETPIAYMLNPAQPEGSRVLGELTSDQVWEMFANTAHQLLDNNDVDYIIPCGTGIQNARHTYLDVIGDTGHLDYDGTHLQEGLPCLIDAYTAVQSLFVIFNIESSIEKSGLRITQDWVNNQKIPGKHGNVIEGSEQDYILCKKCAIAAVEDPYNLSVLQ